MNEIQAAEFIEAAASYNPGVTVVTVHMGALDHCFTTRELLQERLEGAGLLDRINVMIPADGELVEL